MKKIILCAVLLSSFCSFSQETVSSTIVTPPPPVIATVTTPSVAKRTLQEGTIIKVAINEDISGKEVQVGQKIAFTTTEDLIQGDRVILHKGLKVMGSVTEAAKSKGLGKKGKLSFNIEYLYLENGKVVKLRSEVKKNLNGAGGLVVASAILISPVALFVHGKNAKYEKGEVFDAYVDQTAELE
jgi:hypothetical protein